MTAVLDNINWAMNQLIIGSPKL